MAKRPIKHFLEYLLVLAIYYPSRLFSIDATSDFFGNMMEKIGPLIKSAAHRRIKRNIARCFPDWSKEKVGETAKKMWNNLGRFTGEFPHLENLTGDKFWQQVTIENEHYLEEIKKSASGGIIISGHFANWEIMPKAAFEYGMPLTLIYRPANNPYVNKLLLKARSKSHVGGMFPKGKESTRQVVHILTRGKLAGMLVDQKANEGFRLKFFGRDAMTTPGPAQLALKFGCPLLPAVVFRENGAHFRVRIEAPLEIKKTGDDVKDAEAIMQQINDIFENWVREKPEQWLWLHRRWVEN